VSHSDRWSNAYDLVQISLEQFQKLDPTSPEDVCSRISAMFTALRRDAGDDPDVSFALSLSAFGLVSAWMMRHYSSAVMICPLSLAQACEPVAFGAQCERTLIDYVRCIPMSELSDSGEVSRICQYVDSHLAGNLSVKSVLSHRTLSLTRVRHAFARIMGTSVAGYVTLRRMQRAAVLVLDGWKIESAMREVGYQNKTHFNSTFKHVFGRAPKDYRDHAVADHIRQ